MFIVLLSPGRHVAHHAAEAGVPSAGGVRGAGLPLRAAALHRGPEVHWQPPAVQHPGRGPAQAPAVPVSREIFFKHHTQIVCD